MSELTCDLAAKISADFGSLWHCKKRGESLEIVTPFSTVGNQFVTVFVTLRNESFLVSDGGWLKEGCEGYVSSCAFGSPEWVILTQHFSHLFRVNAVENAGKLFFYKKVQNISLLSAAVYDVCNFITSTLAAVSIPQDPVEEVESKETFQRQANGYVNNLGANFQGRVHFRYPLEDLKGVRFSAAIVYPSRISLVSYVTGSTNQYFMHDLRRAIVNFELLEKSKYREMTKSRVALINDGAEGYNGMQSNEAMNLLQERSAVIKWSDRGQLAGVL